MWGLESQERLACIFPPLAPNNHYRLRDIVASHQVAAPTTKHRHESKFDGMNSRSSQYASSIGYLQAADATCGLYVVQ